MSLGERVRSSHSFVVESTSLIGHPVIHLLQNNTERILFENQQANPPREAYQFLADVVTCPYPLTQEDLMEMWPLVWQLFPGEKFQTRRYDVAEMIISAAISQGIDETFAADFYRGGGCEVPKDHPLSKAVLGTLQGRAEAFNTMLDHIKYRNFVHTSPLVLEMTENVSAAINRHLCALNEAYMEPPKILL